MLDALGVPFYNPSEEVRESGLYDMDPPKWKSGQTITGLMPPEYDTSRRIWTVYDPLDECVYYTDADLEGFEGGEVRWRCLVWGFPFCRKGEWYSFGTHTIMDRFQGEIRDHVLLKTKRVDDDLVMHDEGREFRLRVVNGGEVMVVGMPVPFDMGRHKPRSFDDVWDKKNIGVSTSSIEWQPTNSVRFVNDAARGQTFYYFYDKLLGRAFWLQKLKDTWEPYSITARYPVRKEDGTFDPALVPIEGSGQGWIDVASRSVHVLGPDGRLAYEERLPKPGGANGAWRLSNTLNADTYEHGAFCHWTNEVKGTRWKFNVEKMKKQVPNLKWLREESLLDRARRIYGIWAYKRAYMEHAVSRAYDNTVADLRTERVISKRRINAVASQKEVVLQTSHFARYAVFFRHTIAEMQQWMRGVNGPGWRFEGIDGDVGVWEVPLNQYSFFASVRDAVCCAAGAQFAAINNVYSFVQGWVDHLLKLPDESVRRLKEANVQVRLLGFEVQGGSAQMKDDDVRELGRALADLLGGHVRNESIIADFSVFLDVVGLLGVPVGAAVLGSADASVVSLHIRVFSDKTGALELVHGEAGYWASTGQPLVAGASPLVRVFVPLLELRTYDTVPVYEGGSVIRHDLVHGFTVYHLLASGVPCAGLPWWTWLRNNLHHETLDAFPADLTLPSMNFGLSLDAVDDNFITCIPSMATKGVFVEDPRRSVASSALPQGSILPIPDRMKSLNALYSAKHVSLGGFLTLLRAHAARLGGKEDNDASYDNEWGDGQEVREDDNAGEDESDSDDEKKKEPVDLTWVGTRRKNVLNGVNAQLDDAHQTSTTVERCFSVCISDGDLDLMLVDVKGLGKMLSDRKVDDETVVKAILDKVVDWAKGKLVALRTALVGSYPNGVNMREFEDYRYFLVVQRDSPAYSVPSFLDYRGAKEWVDVVNSDSINFFCGDEFNDLAAPPRGPMLSLVMYWDMYGLMRRFREAPLTRGEYLEFDEYRMASPADKEMKKTDVFVGVFKLDMQIMADWNVRLASESKPVYLFGSVAEFVNVRYMDGKRLDGYDAAVIVKRREVYAKGVVGADAEAKGLYKLYKKGLDRMTYCEFLRLRVYALSISEEPSLGDLWKDWKSEEMGRCREFAAATVVNMKDVQVAEAVRGFMARGGRLDRFNELVENKVLTSAVVPKSDRDAFVAEFGKESYDKITVVKKKAEMEFRLGDAEATRVAVIAAMDEAVAVESKRIADRRREKREAAEKRKREQDLVDKLKGNEPKPSGVAKKRGKGKRPNVKGGAKEAPVDDLGDKFLRNGMRAGFHPVLQSLLLGYTFEASVTPKDTHDLLCSGWESVNADDSDEIKEIRHTLANRIGSIKGHINDLYGRIEGASGAVSDEIRGQISAQKALLETAAQIYFPDCGFYGLIMLRVMEIGTGITTAAPVLQNMLPWDPADVSKGVPVTDEVLRLMCAGFDPAVEDGDVTLGGKMSRGWLNFVVLERSHGSDAGYRVAFHSDIRGLGMALNLEAGSEMGAFGVDSLVKLFLRQMRYNVIFLLRDNGKYTLLKRVRSDLNVLARGGESVSYMQMQSECEVLLEDYRKIGVMKGDPYAVTRPRPALLDVPKSAAGGRELKPVYVVEDSASGHSNMLHEIMFVRGLETEEDFSPVLSVGKTGVPQSRIEDNLARYAYNTKTCVVLLRRGVPGRNTEDGANMAKQRGYNLLPAQVVCVFDRRVGGLGFRSNHMDSDFTYDAEASAAEERQVEAMRNFATVVRTEKLRIYVVFNNGSAKTFDVDGSMTGVELKNVLCDFFEVDEDASKKYALILYKVWAGKGKWTTVKTALADECPLCMAGVRNWSEIRFNEAIKGGADAEAVGPGTGGEDDAPPGRPLPSSGDNADVHMALGLDELAAVGDLKGEYTPIVNAVLRRNLYLAVYRILQAPALLCLIATNTKEPELSIVSMVLSPIFLNPYFLDYLHKGVNRDGFAGVTAIVQLLRNVSKLTGVEIMAQYTAAVASLSAEDVFHSVYRPLLKVDNTVIREVVCFFSLFVDRGKESYVYTVLDKLLTEDSGGFYVERRHNGPGVGMAKHRANFVPGDDDKHVVDVNEQRRSKKEIEEAKQKKRDDNQNAGGKSATKVRKEKEPMGTLLPVDKFTGYDKSSDQLSDKRVVYVFWDDESGEGGNYLYRLNSLGRKSVAGLDSEITDYDALAPHYVRVLMNELDRRISIIQLFERMCNTMGVGALNRSVVIPATSGVKTVLQNVEVVARLKSSLWASRVEEFVSQVFMHTTGVKVRATDFGGVKRNMSFEKDDEIIENLHTFIGITEGVMNVIVPVFENHLPRLLDAFWIILSNRRSKSYGLPREAELQCCYKRFMSSMRNFSMKRAVGLQDDMQSLFVTDGSMIRYFVSIELLPGQIRKVAKGFAFHRGVDQQYYWDSNFFDDEYLRENRELIGVVSRGQHVRWDRVAGKEVLNPIDFPCFRDKWYLGDGTPAENSVWFDREREMYRWYCQANYHTYHLRAMDVSHNMTRNNADDRWKLAPELPKYNYQKKEWNDGRVFFDPVLDTYCWLDYSQTMWTCDEPVEAEKIEWVRGKVGGEGLTGFYVEVDNITTVLNVKCMINRTFDIPVSDIVIKRIGGKDKPLDHELVTKQKFRDVNSVRGRRKLFCLTFASKDTGNRLVKIKQRVVERKKYQMEKSIRSEAPGGFIDDNVLGPEGDSYERVRAMMAFECIPNDININYGSLNPGPDVCFMDKYAVHDTYRQATTLYERYGDGEIRDGVVRFAGLNQLKRMYWSDVGIFTKEGVLPVRARQTSGLEYYWGSNVDVSIRVQRSEPFKSYVNKRAAYKDRTRMFLEWVHAPANWFWDSETKTFCVFYFSANVMPMSNDAPGGLRGVKKFLGLENVEGGTKPVQELVCIDVEPYHPAGFNKGKQAAEWSKFTDRYWSLRFKTKEVWNKVDSDIPLPESVASYLKSDVPFADWTAQAQDETRAVFERRLRKVSENEDVLAYYRLRTRRFRSIYNGSVDTVRLRCLIPCTHAVREHLKNTLLEKMQVLPNEIEINYPVPSDDYTIEIVHYNDGAGHFNLDQQVLDSMFATKEDAMRVLDEIKRKQVEKAGRKQEERDEQERYKHMTDEEKKEAGRRYEEEFRKRHSSAASGTQHVKKPKQRRMVLLPAVPEKVAPARAPQRPSGNGVNRAPRPAPVVDDSGWVTVPRRMTKEEIEARNREVLRIYHEHRMRGKGDRRNVSCVIGSAMESVDSVCMESEMGLDALGAWDEYSDSSDDDVAGLGAPWGGADDEFDASTSHAGVIHFDYVSTETVETKRWGNVSYPNPNNPRDVMCLYELRQIENRKRLLRVFRDKFGVSYADYLRSPEAQKINGVEVRTVRQWVHEVCPGVLGPTKRWLDDAHVEPTKGMIDAFISDWAMFHNDKSEENRESYSFFLQSGRAWPDRPAVPSGAQEMSMGEEFAFAWDFAAKDLKTPENAVLGQSEERERLEAAKRVTEARRNLSKTASDLHGKLQKGLSDQLGIKMDLDYADGDLNAGGGNWATTGYAQVSGFHVSAADLWSFVQDYFVSHRALYFCVAYFCSVHPRNITVLGLPVLERIEGIDHLEYKIADPQAFVETVNALGKNWLLSFDQILIPIYVPGSESALMVYSRNRGFHVFGDWALPTAKRFFDGPWKYVMDGVEPGAPERAALYCVTYSFMNACITNLSNKANNILRSLSAAMEAVYMGGMLSEGEMHAIYKAASTTPNTPVSELRECPARLSGKQKTFLSESMVRMRGYMRNHMNTDFRFNRQLSLRMPLIVCQALEERYKNENSAFDAVGEWHELEEFRKKTVQAGPTAEMEQHVELARWAQERADRLGAGHPAHDQYLGACVWHVGRAEELLLGL